MEITIKTIRNVAVSNLIILSLAACSSSPASWTKYDDSPWVTKYAAEEKSTLSDESVSDASLNDPVLLEEPEPEPIIMYEPEVAAAAAEVIDPVMVELAVEEGIMSMSDSSYAIQVYAGKTTESVDRYKTDNGLDDLITVKTDRSGSIVYVLVDVRPDRDTANAAASDLEIKTGSKPWVRSIAGLQKIAIQ